MTNLFLHKDIRDILEAHSEPIAVFSTSEILKLNWGKLAIVGGEMKIFQMCEELTGN